MNDKPLTPHGALEAAESAQAAASTLTPPSWYAPTNLLLFTAGVALAGAAPQGTSAYRDHMAAVHRLAETAARQTAV